MPLHKKNNRVNTRKIFNKRPPLVLNSPNMQPSSPYLSPPSSPRSKVSRPTSYENTNISSSASTPNLSMLSSSIHENQYNIDTLLNKLNLKVIRYPLNFTFKITPYSGLVQNIFDEKNLQ